MNEILLCTDLDRTLIPNGSQPESAIARSLFSRFVQRDDVKLVYVTGRHKELVEEAISTYDLPLPDYVVADVGANIYRVDQSGWHQMKNWCAHISVAWQGQSHKELYQKLKSIPQLKLQEAEKQRRHKLSFYVSLETELTNLMSQINALLTQANIQVNIIWSIDEAENIGLLDILPASANKLMAISFLMKQQDFMLRNTIFAGDSGNDMDVLVSEIPSVLVANAHDEIKKMLETVSEEKLYTAQGGYLGMNGNYSAGILEGVAHYLPEVDLWLRKQSAIL